jgi:hypothetical protein
MRWRPSARPSSKYRPSTVAAESLTNHVLLPQGTNWGRSRTDASDRPLRLVSALRTGLDLFLLSRMTAWPGSHRSVAIADSRFEKDRMRPGKLLLRACVRASAAMAFVTGFRVHPGLVLGLGLGLVFYVWPVYSHRSDRDLPPSPLHSDSRPFRDPALSSGCLTRTTSGE